MIGQNSSGFEISDPGQIPAEEIPDHQDNDCDGLTDEGLPCNPGETHACGVAAGVCAEGTQVCEADAEWSNLCIGELRPTGFDACDGLDNDCNGITDDLYAVNTPCVALGECRNGVTECADSLTTRCSSAPGGSAHRERPEICDEKDNDCDGQTDEDEVCVNPPPQPDAGFPPPVSDGGMVFSFDGGLPPPPPPPPPPPSF